MREVYDRETRTFVPAEEYYARVAATVTRSDLAAPHVIRDIEPYRSVVNGQWVTSRRQHRDIAKAHGLIEVGNDPAILRKNKPKPLPSAKQAVKDAIEQLRSGYKAAPKAETLREPTNFH